MATFKFEGSLALHSPQCHYHCSHSELESARNLAGSCLTLWDGLLTSHSDSLLLLGDSIAVLTGCLPFLGLPFLGLPCFLFSSVFFSFSFFFFSFSSSLSFFCLCLSSSLSILSLSFSLLLFSFFLTFLLQFFGFLLLSILLFHH